MLEELWMTRRGREDEKYSIILIFSKQMAII
jgi:hypothetical protein